MTEIPAKTPRPIGKTDNFLPGIEDSAAATTETPAAEGWTDEEVSGGGIVLVVGEFVSLGKGTPPYNRFPKEFNA